MRIEADQRTCAAVKIQDEFELGLGEWFLDVTQGVPYIGTVLGVKNPNVAAIRAMFRSIILQAPGIVAVQELRVDYDPRARTLAYSFVAVDNTGAIVKGGNQTFVVQTPGKSAA